MIKLNYDELKKYKKDNGRICLDGLVENADGEREVRGNDKREKTWYDINDGRIMFKANTAEQQNAHYSELICCELAKQAGLETATYDFAEYNGESGIITRDVCKPKEEIITINELIGNGPTNPDYPDCTDIYFVFENLEYKLMNSGYDLKTVDNCMLQLRKQMLFDLYVMETDRHTENLSFIFGKDEVTGKPSVRLSPMYDTESALALYDDEEHMQKVSSSAMLTASVTNMQEPKICVIPEEEEEIEGETLGQSFLQQLQAQVGTSYASKSEEIWKTTLDFLIEDERAYDYLENVLNNMNIGKAIQSVEINKDCKIPDEVKNMAIACFEDRRNAIAYDLCLDIEMDDIQAICDRGVDISRD